MSKKLLPLTKNESGEYETLIKKVSVWDGKTLDSSWNVVESDGYYHIKSASQMAHYLSQSANNKQIQVKLDVNCDLSTGDVSSYEISVENGLFDGQFHKIKYNNTIRKTSAFASANSGGLNTLKNLIVEGMYVYTGTTFDQGQFCGRNENRSNSGQIFENVMLIGCKWDIAGASYGNMGWYYNRYGTVGRGLTYNGLFFQDCEWINRNNLFHRSISTSGIYGRTWGFINCKNSHTSTLDTNIEAINVGLEGSWNTRDGVVYEDIESFVETYNESTQYEKMKIMDGKVVFESYNPLSNEVLHNRKKTKESPYKDMPPLPEGSDFLWLAQDYTGSRIPNVVEGSYYGDLMQTWNTSNGVYLESHNGPGYEAYLHNATNQTCLTYSNIDTEHLNQMKANASDSAYTWIFRGGNRIVGGGAGSADVSAVCSFRGSYNDSNYRYMIRLVRDGQISIDGQGSFTMRQTNIDNDDIWMFVVEPSKITCTNLTKGTTESMNIYTARNMTNKLTTMTTYYANEGTMDRWYGLYGIPRKLNDDEIFNVMINMGYYEKDNYERVITSKLPEDSAFLFLADDYDSVNKKIVNRVEDSEIFGELIGNGTLYRDYWGQYCYLRNTGNSNFLYRTLTTDELNLCKANTEGSCFTYIIKASANTSGMGGLLSFRNGSSSSNMTYMLRVDNGMIGVNFAPVSGSTNYQKTIQFIDENTYSFVIKPTSITVTNLDTNESMTIETGTNRVMSSQMRLMNAGYNNENAVTKFFGCYGAFRELNENEIQLVYNYIKNGRPTREWYKLGDPKLLLINQKNVRK